MVNQRAKQIGGLALAAAALVASGFFLRDFMRGTGGGAMQEATSRRAVMDPETGEVFKDYWIEQGDQPPYAPRFSGERRLYPAEKCYWTEDGKAKLEPTYVVLNQYRGIEGPTLCPDCGREVTFRNPQPPDELLLEAAKAAEGGSSGQDAGDDQAASDSET